MLLVFTPHRKDIYAPPRLVTGIALLLCMLMVFIPHRKDIYAPPRLVTGTTLLVLLRVVIRYRSRIAGICCTPCRATRCEASLGRVLLQCKTEEKGIKTTTAAASPFRCLYSRNKQANFESPLPPPPVLLVVVYYYDVDIL
jgi:hypothetical protein